jgi:hypothetical protein
MPSIDDNGILSKIVGCSNDEAKRLETKLKRERN